MLNEHMSAKKDHNQLICDLLNFELMNRIFFGATDMKHRIKNFEA